MTLLERCINHVAAKRREAWRKSDMDPPCDDTLRMIAEKEIDRMTNTQLINLYDEVSIHDH